MEVYQSGASSSSAASSYLSTWALLFVMHTTWLFEGALFGCRASTLPSPCTNGRHSFKENNNGTPPTLVTAFTADKLANGCNYSNCWWTMVLCLIYPHIIIARGVSGCPTRKENLVPGDSIAKYQAAALKPPFHLMNWFERLLLGTTTLCKTFQ